MLHLRKSEITDLTLFALTGELCEAFYSVICDIFPCCNTYYIYIHTAHLCGRFR